MIHLLRLDVLAVLLAALLLMGCNETGGSSGGGTDDSASNNQDDSGTNDSTDSDGDPDTDTQDTLEVISNFPEDGATGVPVDAVVYAEMDRPIDNTWANDEMELTLNGALVPGSVESLDSSHDSRITYTPAQALEKSTEYQVTLNAGQLSANDGSTLTNDYQWSFTTSDKAWSNSQRLDASGDAAYDPVPLDPLDSGFVKTVIDDQGNIFTVWSELNVDQTTFDVMFRHYDAGTGLLSSPEVVGQTTTGFEYDPGFGEPYTNWAQSRPAIALDGNGNAWVAWAENTDASQRMLARYYSKSQGWQAPRELGTSNNANSAAEPFTSPDLEVNSHGDAVVVWSQRRSNNNGETVDMIRAATYKADTDTWSTEAKLEAYDEVAGIDVNWGSRRAVNPAVALHEDGTAIATWLENYEPDSQYSNQNETVFARRFNGTAWDASAQRLEPVDIGTDSDLRPRIQVAGSGTTGVFWHHPDEGFRFAAHTAGGGWSKTVTVHNPSEAKLARYRASADGLQMLAWTEGDTLKTSLKTASGDWSEPQSTLAQDMPIQELVPALSGSGDISLVVVEGSWVLPSTSLGISLVRYTNGQWQPIRSVSNQGIWPDHAINSNGEASLVYHLDAGQLPEYNMGASASSVYLRHYD